MTIDDSLLPHTCKVTQRRRTGSPDEFGNPTITETTLATPIRCRFAHRQCTHTDQGDVITADCIIAPTDAIQEGDFLETANIPYKGKYWVQTIGAAIYPDGTEHHRTLTLRSVTP